MPTARSEDGRPWARACASLIVLGTLFFATYGFANWMASRHAHVPSFVFEWERKVPFIAWTIVPYWSIDFLYALSVLLCRNVAELGVQVRRLLTAQVLSILCFLAFPLSFSFDRPPVDGVFGAMFDALAAFDKPFNQAPSLHIVLLIVIWGRLAAHVSATWLRWALHAWMLLIGVSVLTTFQHHFVDIPTGMLGGFLCLWIWPETGRSPLAGSVLARDFARRRIGVRYAAGAAIAAVLAMALGGAGLWLWWPAVSLAMVASFYLWIGVAGFQKDAAGRMSVATRWLLAPYLLAAWINSRWWTRGQPWASHVADGVWIGRFPSAATLAAGTYGGVVDLCAELPAPECACAYEALPVLDLTMPSRELLVDAAGAIEQKRAEGQVLVCCALGYSRSAAAVATWLVATGRAVDRAAAVQVVQRARPRIVLDPMAMPSTQGLR